LTIPVLVRSSEGNPNAASSLRDCFFSLNFPWTGHGLLSGYLWKQTTSHVSLVKHAGL
ncbi:hypothetical protein CRM22_007367, partial [Opisthorchis felineus]